MTYPFEPKSTSRLEAGHFWALPLSDGSFAAAVVVSEGTNEVGSRHSRLFIAGLLDWHGRHQPAPADLEGRSLLKTGVAHTRSVQRTGGTILGLIPCNWPAPTTTQVFRYMPLWGYGYAQAMAERHFVAGQALEQDLSFLAKLKPPQPEQ